MVLDNTRTDVPPFRSSYVPEGPTQVAFRASEFNILQINKGVQLTSKQQHAGTLSATA